MERYERERDTDRKKEECRVGVVVVVSRILIRDQYMMTTNY